MSKLKSSDIRAAMAKRWAAPEWAIMWEVGQGTGGNSGRYADAVMMSLWPSRGLELHGVEIKVSRSDWKREAADPSKAEAVARYCDRWWVHTTPGVVDDISDVPPAWGLREWTGKRWDTLREAEKTTADPVTRPFLAALLRRADGAMKSLMDEAMREARAAHYDEAEKQRQRFAETVDKEVERRTARLSEAAENVAKFEAAFGSARSWGCQPELWGRAARALADAQSTDSYRCIVKRFRDAADEIEALQSMLITEDRVEGEA